MKGNKVIANAGGNLTIESEQDKKNYKETGKTTGLSISYTPGSAVSVSGGKGKTNTDSAYESVTKQAGIYAGKEGYDIQVKNNTRLKGAVIDSKAPAEKNKLTTGTLTWENIDNKAEYKASGKGISYTNGAGIPLNALGLLSNMGPTVKDKAGTTTTSAVSKGTITITDKENQKQDIEKLNRNTEDSLNKLKEIFDKTKVEERKRLLEELGIVGNQAIHEIASPNGWKDGSAEKAAIHGMLGAITGAKSRGSPLSGLIAGGANEYAIGYLKKTKGKDWINKHPDTVQNISAAFGGILSKMTGGSGHTGAYISQMGTKWNLILENIPSFRESLNDDTTVNNLPVGYGQILTISGGKYGVSAGESVFVFHADGGNPVLVSTNVNVGIGMSFPMSGEAGRVWLTDSYGNLVIDSKVIMRELSGGVLDWSITAGMKYNESTAANGYILHIESMAPEISVQGGSYAVC